MKRLMALLGMLCVLLVGASSVQAATPDGATVVKVRQQLTAHHFIGTALIVHNGHTLLQYSSGYANANLFHLQRNTIGSCYQLASVQKVFTAVLFMQLVQAGKVQLNTPLSRYYPQIAQSKKITLRQVLDMNSGLYSSVQPQKMMSDRQIIAFAVKHVKVKQIGQHNYQPVNYTLLAGIVERLTGKSYQTVVRQRLLKPLNLQHTGFMVNDFKKEQHAAIGYTTTYAYLPYLQRHGETQAELNAKLGTGNMYSDATDLFHLEQAIQQGRFLTAANVATLFDATDGSYRGGLYSYRDFVVSHGVEGGYEVGLSMSRDGKSGVILLTNHRSDLSLAHDSQQIYRQLKL
ncbi:serine hydrolase domain-containing protein [Loigolactobacillus binensis]|uniref:Serine hydrolase domain-containing protein n=1 Tax=Loigolactobacillus binensis TaxID=2559922 RepID=A0ABW3E972_9LACO|nr:serine hydrolase domain-containing protein [Loigolactobacillus binensis]